MRQYLWHSMYEYALKELRRHNTGVCKVKGKQIEDLIHHLIVVRDET